MEESKQVRLHGFWASPYVHRVIWALKLKGVQYEYIEEDLPNKSAALLELNPVHKKVPLLVHGGNPVAESVVILNYIEEAWPHHTPLLPKDPHGRATARFWIDFGQQKSSTFWAFFLSSEENREENARKVVETLEMIEDGGLGDKKFFGGDAIGLIDLFYGWLVHWLEPMEKINGVRILEAKTLPRLHRWSLDFKQEPLIKESLPDSAMLLGQLQMVKNRFTLHQPN
ncbi:hypothetical protein C2S52_002384 [Perilla frutescens var. hirtella]|nr:hypothetical protein C2S51_013026 [Perilla frutescens var. frutescens]KAH6791907.1 hypothetical protein C2S52_002384 [Perilla frutescens var. hirtella]